MTDRRVESRIAAGRADLAAWEASKPDNFFEADGCFQRVLRMHLGDSYGTTAARLRVTGGLVADPMDELARSCNRDENLPALRAYDGIGQQREEVAFTAAHHELGGYIWRTGVLSVLGDPGRDLECGANVYLLSHLGEAGHICPVACAAGLIKLLQAVGTDEQRARYLPRLLDPDYRTRLHASQFVTEVQGGSDVGANGCVAEPDPERPGAYRISGEKWFCSVMDASLFVMTARVSDTVAGTRGLGLFLVPREVDGRPNGFSIRRLKYKLGTRSMASGEADFDRTLAEPLGPPEQGFKNLISIVLDTSRVHNALAAAGFMRRACTEAKTFAQHRQAFGKPIIGFPAVRATLARMEMLARAAMATSFRLLALSDRLAAAQAADKDLVAARRVHVNINKYWTSVACTAVVRDGIEILGGNGTIEDFSVLPRLYRDAIVLESWEGSHNTLCAQVLRDFAQRALHRPWLADLTQLAADIDDPTLADHRKRAEGVLEDLSRRIDRLLEGDELYATRHIRQVVDRMCQAHAFLCLLQLLQWEQKEGLATDTAQVVELYRLTVIDPTDPMDAPQMAELELQLSGSSGAAI